MHRLTYFILIISLISMIYGCNQHAHRPINNLPDSTKKRLNDSLSTLDSIISRKRMAKLSESLKYARKAVEIANKLSTPEAYAKTYIMLGNVYFSSKIDSGFYFYNKAMTQIDSFNLVRERALVLYNLGMLHRKASNYKTSIILLDSALTISRWIPDFVTMSNSLNSLGNIYIDMGDEGNARKMYDSAYAIAKARSLYLQMGTALGNLAKFESMPDASIRMNKNAITILKKTNGADEPIALILINIGNKQTIPDSAIYYFNQVLKMVDVENAPEIVIGTYNNLAYSYLDKGDLVNAEKCINEHALPVALSTQSLDWQSTVYDTYSDILSKKGKLAEALNYEKKSIETMGAANKQSALKQIRLLAAMLDLKNKEDIIKDDRIEIVQTNSRLRNRNQWIIIILLFVGGFGGYFIIWTQKKRIQIQRQQIESAKKIIEAEETEKAKISRDIHDLTGQKFSFFTDHLEGLEYANKEARELTLTMAADINDIVREISHRINRTWLEQFTLEQTIRGLCADVIKITNLDLDFNAPAEFPEIPKDTKIHIFRIIQELLSNAVKYASGSKVVINISFKTGNLVLEYNDKGPGFIRDASGSKGMGVSNLFERVKLLRGKVELITEKGYGTYYGIIIPLS